MRKKIFYTFLIIIGLRLLVIFWNKITLNESEEVEKFIQRVEMLNSSKDYYNIAYEGNKYMKYLNDNVEWFTPEQSKKISENLNNLVDKADKKIDSIQNIREIEKRKTDSINTIKNEKEKQFELEKLKLEKENTNSIENSKKTNSNTQKTNSNKKNNYSDLMLKTSYCKCHKENRKEQMYEMLGDLSSGERGNKKLLSICVSKLKYDTNIKLKKGDEFTPDFLGQVFYEMCEIGFYTGKFVSNKNQKFYPSKTYK